jgi:hypothetical protein
MLIAAHASISQESQGVSPSRIADAWEASWAQIETLLVKYSVKHELLVDPVQVKRYLGIGVLRSDNTTFAQKGQKRYYCKISPEFLDTIAPGVEPDYDVVPNGAERKRQQFAQTKMLGPAAFSIRSKERRVRAVPKHVVAYDGERVYRDTFDQIVSVQPASIHDPTLSSAFRCDYLELAGREVPNPFGQPERAVAQGTPRFGILGRELLNSGYQVLEASEAVDSKACVLLTNSVSDAVWCDPQMNYAIRKRDVRLTDIGHFVIHNSDFFQVARQIWLPRRCILEQCAPDGAPSALRGKSLARLVYTLESASTGEIPDSLFTLAFKPGTLVIDSDGPIRAGSSGTVTYIAPASESELEETVARAIETAARARRWETILLCAKIALATAVACGLWYVTLRLYRHWRAGKQVPA